MTHVEQGGSVSSIKYLISYDLRDPEKDYKKLIDALRGSGAERVLRSQWVVSFKTRFPNRVLEGFKKYIDENDRMLVVSLDSGDHAGFKLITEIESLEDS